MAFRFFRRFRIAPGVSLNLSKRGGSLSFGPRGAKITAGTSGVRRTVSVPGTGLWYTEHTSSRKRSRKQRRGGSPSPSADHPPPPKTAARDRLALGFFRRLFTPSDERALVDGLREIVAGRETKAFEHLRDAEHLADGAYVAGMLAFKREAYADAERRLLTALKRRQRLGTYFSKYGLDLTLTLPISETVAAHVGPTVRAVRLALAEVYQAQHRWCEAIDVLETLRRSHPDDPVVRVALAELLVDDAHATKRTLKRVVRLTEGTENESEVHAALLLYKGIALRGLGLHTASRDALTTAFRRKKDRSDELLRAIQYERALTYEALGRNRRAREEFEKIYAEDPDHEDVAARLGLG